MHWILKLDKLINMLTEAIGKLVTLMMILLVLNVFYDVIMRYVFNDVSIGMQELEWHLFAAMFLLGVPYAMQHDSHVRVDIFYDSWGDKAKAWINLLGVLLFVMPFATLVAWYGIDFAREAYDIGEGSGDPGGLPYRWIIKGVIPLSFCMIAVAGLGMIAKALKVLVLGLPYDPEEQVDLA